MKYWKQNAYLQKLLTETGTETGTGPGSSRTLRRRRQSQEIEADSSEDDLEEPTPSPSPPPPKKRETLNKVIVIIFGLHTLRVNLQILYKLPHRFKYFMHQYTSIAYMGKNVTSYNKYYFCSDSGCAGRGLRWKATPLMPNLAEYQHQDETDLDRHGWTPLD